MMRHFTSSTASLDRAMVVIMELGDWVVTTAVTLAALIWLLWRHKQRTTLYLCAAVVASGSFYFLLKLGYRQQVCNFLL
jgi:hypothetical protein